MSHASPHTSAAPPHTAQAAGAAYATGDVLDYAHDPAEFTAPDTPGSGSVVPSMLGTSGGGGGTDDRSPSRSARSGGLQSTEKTLATQDANAFTRRLASGGGAATAPGNPAGSLPSICVDETI